MMDCDRCGQPFFDYEGYDEELQQEEEESLEESA